LAKRRPLTWVRIDDKMASGRMSDTPQTVTANGRKINAGLPVSLHGFLESQGMLPRSVVVELNGEAVPPSEFSDRELKAGDSMEIVKVVAGG